MGICFLANGAKWHLPLRLIGSMQEKFAPFKRRFWLLSKKHVRYGEKRWGYFRIGFRKSRIKAKSPPKACTFALLGVMYIEYAGDWKRKEHAKLCNFVGSSSSNCWPGSNLPPTCSYKSQWLVFIQPGTCCYVHCMYFPMENSVEQ